MNRRKTKDELTFDRGWSTNGHAGNDRKPVKEKALPKDAKRGKHVWFSLHGPVGIRR